MIALHLEDSLAMDKTAYGLLSTMLNVPIFDKSNTPDNTQEKEAL